MLERIKKFFAGAENGIGVLEGHPAGFSQNQLTVLSDEEGLAEFIFQVAELNAECGLGDIHFGGGAGEAAFMRDGAKIAQMMIVEKHTPFSHIAYRTILYKTSIGKKRVKCPILQGHDHF